MAFLDELRRSDNLIRQHHPHEVGAPILRAANLSVRYENVSALDDVSFELEEGERLAVVGPNGAGKSTLFKVIAGVQKPTEGQVHVYGHEPGGHICIAYVPQRSQVDWSFPVSVADVVMMGRIGKLRLFRQPRKRDWDIVQQALEVVRMQHLAKRQISELSGGQQQRVFIARALAQEAGLMLMDEPLTGLDINSKNDIFQIFDELRQHDVTVLVAMHDLQMAAERFDRVMLLNVQLLGLGTPAEVFTSEKLVQAYGGHLRLIQTDEGVLAIEDTCCGEGEEI
ncbi:MAG: metal ABC transporter ATP-binding protein [Chloroflexota bacterium]|nr:metal ABC transporter ATP-binding protein [Chloroflexota bacterium]